jgi:hypothetical protein
VHHIDGVDFRIDQTVTISCALEDQAMYVRVVIKTCSLNLGLKFRVVGTLKGPGGGAGKTCFFTDPQRAEILGWQLTRRWCGTDWYLTWQKEKKKYGSPDHEHLMTIDHSIHPTSGGQYAFFFSLALVNFTYPCMEFLVRIIGFSLLHYTYQMKKK